MFFHEPFGGLLPGARGAVLAKLLRTDAPMTGRQIHSLVSDHFSLWSVQEALKVLGELGVVETRTIGRAGVHTINEDHFAISPLRRLLDPIAVLREVIRDHIDVSVEAVVLFGSVARGEAVESSDVDLAVIAGPSWMGRVELEDDVRRRLGSHCDVLAFTPAQFAKLIASGEPVVGDIVKDGIVLAGTNPHTRIGVA